MHLARQLGERTGHRPAALLLGMAMAGGALLAAWMLNQVFGQSWRVIALFLLAMLTIILLRRMIAGAIPEPELSWRDDTQEQSEPRDLGKISAELPGIDRGYGWMALPPAIAFGVVLASLLV
jgi:hypothetical protein